MSKALSKKELKRPDAFMEIGLKAGKWIEDNIKMLLGVLGLALVTTLVWLAYGYYQSSQESKAAEAIFPVETLALESINKTKSPETPNLAELLNTLKAHGHTKSALSSAIAVIGALQGLEGSEGLQKEIVETITYKPSSGSILYGLSKMTWGQVALNNDDVTGAEKAFKDVLGESSQKALHASALIQLGSIAEKKNDFKEARDFYQRVIREFPDTESKRIAEKLIIHLDLLSESPIQGS